MHTATATLHGAPVRILGGGGHAATRGRDTPRHRHDCWELVYYRSGNPQFVVADGPTAASAGTVWLTPPGRPHAERALTAFTNWYIAVEAPADQPWPLVGRDDAQGALERLCGAIVSECRRDAPDREPMLACLAAELDLRLRRLGSGPQRRSLVAEAEVLLELAESPLSMGALARRLGVAASTLRASFHRERGAAPSAVWRDLRARRAAALLVHTDMTLASIAGQCGFHSASHLSRWIRRRHGCSPGDLRRGSAAHAPATPRHTAT
jgi:AraC-like DNA-binding protein